MLVKFLDNVLITLPFGTNPIGYVHITTTTVYKYYEAVSFKFMKLL